VTAAEEAAEQKLVEEVKKAEAEKQAADLQAQTVVVRAEADRTAAEKTTEAKKMLAEAVQAEVAAPGLAEAQVKIEKAAAIEKEGTAEAKVAELKFQADAKGITEKAEAMKLFDGVGKEHEEFKLRLNKEKEVELEAITAQQKIAEAQAAMIAESLTNANIDIVGGDNKFFDSIVNSITAGKQVDRLVDNSSVLSDVKNTFFTGDPMQFKDEVGRSECWSGDCCGNEVGIPRKSIRSQSRKRLGDFSNALQSLATSATLNFAESDSKSHYFLLPIACQTNLNNLSSQNQPKAITRHSWSVERTNNCVAQDIVPIGEQFIFGYNVHMGLKTTTELADVFGVFRFSEGSMHEQPLDLFEDKAFLTDFNSLYKYYKDTRFQRFHLTGPHLYFVFQVGNSYDDTKAFKFLVDDGALKYVDNRSDHEIVLPPQHDFKWVRTHRDLHRDGEHPHISIDDRVFVEAVGGDLTIKIEDNTDDGSGIYAEPVDDPDQTLDDGEYYYSIVGNIILLKIKPCKRASTRRLRATFRILNSSGELPPAMAKTICTCFTIRQPAKRCCCRIT